MRFDVALFFEVRGRIRLGLCSTLLARTLKALPEDDALYKEAYALLNKLAKAADE